jgi:para-aminobenzoate synthetase component 2
VADVLVVDNHDSFVHTLVGYLHELGATTGWSRRMPSRTPSQRCRLPRHPRLAGTGPPEDAGASIDVVRTARCTASRCSACASATRCSRRVRRADGRPELMHGTTSRGAARRRRSSQDCPRPHRDALPLARGRSDGASDDLVGRRARRRASSWRSPTGRRRCACSSIPEAVLTVGGYRLLGNWLTQIGGPTLADAATRGAALTPHRLVG